MDIRLNTDQHYQCVTPVNLYSECSKEEIKRRGDDKWAEQLNNCPLLIRRCKTKKYLPKTYSDKLKDNILRVRLNRRKSYLLKITSENIKLFRRLQAKRSFYKNRVPVTNLEQREPSGNDSERRLDSEANSVFTRSHLKLRCASTPKLLLKYETLYHHKTEASRIQISSVKEIRLRELCEFRSAFYPNTNILRDNKEHCTFTTNLATRAKNMNTMATNLLSLKMSKQRMNEKENETPYHQTTSKTRIWPTCLTYSYARPSKFGLIGGKGLGKYVRY